MRLLSFIFIQILFKFLFLPFFFGFSFHFFVLFFISIFIVYSISSSYLVFSFYDAKIGIKTILPNFLCRFGLLDFGLLDVLLKNLGKMERMNVFLQ